MNDYYDILGISPTASPSEIKSAYRREALESHPDTNPDDPTAEARFKKLAEAYTILFDSQSRGAYDRRGYDGHPPTSPEGFSRSAADETFWSAMIQLATELTYQNVRADRVAPELVSRGCPRQIAVSIAASAEARRKTKIRTHARRLLVRAAVTFALGALVTAIGIGLGYVVYVGLALLVSGVYNAARAAWFISTGRVPKTGQVA